MNEFKPNNRSVTSGEAGLPKEPSEEIIALYREHIPEYLEVLRTAVQEEDKEAMMFQCHKISSAVKIMGFDNIGALLDKIHDEQPEGAALVSQCERVIVQVNHTLLILSQ